MTPTIGRIIHVYEPLNDQCLAAIVTAVDYGRSTPMTVYATVFPPHGSMTDSARRLTITEAGGSWHDPRDCSSGRLSHLPKVTGK
jgi:hypothetical protein